MDSCKPRNREMLIQSLLRRMDVKCSTIGLAHLTMKVRKGYNTASRWCLEWFEGSCMAVVTCSKIPKEVLPLFAMRKARYKQFCLGSMLVQTHANRSPWLVGRFSAVLNEIRSMDGKPRSSAFIIGVEEIRIINIYIYINIRMLVIYQLQPFKWCI